MPLPRPIRRRLGLRVAVSTDLSISTVPSKRRRIDDASAPAVSTELTDALMFDSDEGFESDNNDGVEALTYDDDFVSSCNGVIVSQAYQIKDATELSQRL